MNALKDIQTLARDTIAAFEVDSAPYFTDALVVANVGNSFAAIEEALNGDGFVVEVTLPGSARVFSRAPGVAEVEVAFIVLVRVNPQRNSESGGAGIDVLEAVDNVCAALLQYNPGNESSRFEIEDEAFALLTEDPGLIEYGIAVRAFATLS